MTSKICEKCNGLERLCDVCWGIERAHFEEKYGGSERIRALLELERWDDEYAEELEKILRED